MNTDSSELVQVGSLGADSIGAGSVDAGYMDAGSADAGRWQGSIGSYPRVGLIGLGWTDSDLTDTDLNDDPHPR